MKEKSENTVRYRSLVRPSLAGYRACAIIKCCMHRTALKLFAVTVSFVPNIAAADGGLGAIGGIVMNFGFEHV
jgi:hypothetical protein